MFDTKRVWDTMRSNSFPFVLMLLRRSLRLFWRENHTRTEDKISRETGSGGKEGPREGRESQSTM